jgi:hypothetical protein
MNQSAPGGRGAAQRLWREKHDPAGNLLRSKAARIQAFAGFFSSIQELCFWSLNEECESRRKSVSKLPAVGKRNSGKLLNKPETVGK